MFSLYDVDSLKANFRLHCIVILNVLSTQYDSHKKYFEIWNICCDFRNMLSIFLEWQRKTPGEYLLLR